MYGIGIPELIVLLGLVLLIWAFINIIRSSFKNLTLKIIWLLIVIFIPFLGPISYFLIGRKQKNRA